MTDKEKDYNVADIMELIKISNEFIERNRKVYKRLAAGIPTQEILDALIPELISLYGNYVMQIVQYKTSLSRITLAILTSSDYSADVHTPIYRQRQDIAEKYNDLYGADTLIIVEYRYEPVRNSKVHSSVTDMIRKGNVIWEKEEDDK
ncbi:hypothetical protein [Blautia obeum]|uniref:Uncharacterized protein n=1 Tax=Blautia obeum TaxID=40520 RepID=A0A411ZSU6_9FIRM|nr:hypothetical protein [Blautia obeum]RGQ05892.1 hypothetical protein DWZ12_05335 [Blautia obeum]